MAEKITENGDNAYNSTGNNMVDLLFMADFFQKNIDQAHIGDSYREQLFSMYMRDPRHGQGRRDLGRKLMELSNVNPSMVILAGRFDDLWKNPSDENIARLFVELKSGNELAKKWMPRLTGKDKKLAKALCKMLDISEKEYRKLIKTETTTEYKMSYAEKVSDGTPLDELFGNKGVYTHPLVDSINFEQVPSLAMTKYMKAFSTRKDIKDRFVAYIQDVKQNKAKVNTATTNVHDAYKVVRSTEHLKDVQDNADVIGKKIVEKNTENLALNCICVLDTSGSMGSLRDANSLCSKATSVAHSLATHSTYAPNQVVSFSSRPRLMTIKGERLTEQYDSMYTGDCSNTDFGRVMELLKGLKSFPQYLIVMSDMEFDQGSSKSKKDTMTLFSELGVPTRIIWWNFNDRNRTSPEYDEYGNIYMSGFDLQALLQVPGVMDMDEYLDKLLHAYAQKINISK